MGKRPTIEWQKDLPRSFLGWLWQRYEYDAEKRFRPFVTRTAAPGNHWYKMVQKLKAAGWVKAHLARNCENPACHGIDSYKNRTRVYHVRFTDLGVEEMRVILTHLLMAGTPWITQETWASKSNRGRFRLP